MLGGGPEFRSTWMEFPVLLHEISTMKMEDGRRERERQGINPPPQKNDTHKIACFKIPDIEFLVEISKTALALDIHFNLGFIFTMMSMFICTLKKKNESNSLTHKD